jgi:hypothetical protein
MAKKTPQVLQISDKKHPFVSFANFYPTKTDKEKIKSEATRTGALLFHMADLVQEGYAFKIAWDDKSNCFNVMMIGERTTTFNQGWIQSARHVEIETAVSACLYQHLRMAGGESWDASSEDMFNTDW